MANLFVSKWTVSTLPSRIHGSILLDDSCTKYKAKNFWQVIGTLKVWNLDIPPEPSKKSADAKVSAAKKGEHGAGK